MPVQMPRRSSQIPAQSENRDLASDRQEPVPTQLPPPRQLDAGLGVSNQFRAPSCYRNREQEKRRNGEVVEREEPAFVDQWPCPSGDLIFRHALGEEQPGKDEKQET